MGNAVHLLGIGIFGPDLIDQLGKIQHACHITGRRVYFQDMGRLPFVAIDIAIDVFQLIKVADITIVILHGQHLKEVKRIGMDIIKIARARAHDQAGTVMGKPPSLSLIGELPDFPEVGS